VADTELQFSTKTIDGFKIAANWIGAVSLDSKSGPTVVVANQREVQVGTAPSFSFPSGSSSAWPGPDAILPIDFNYDFKNDLVLAGAGGVRFHEE
jgi:hypothetical protein